MEPEVGNAPSGCKSTLKEAESGSSSEKSGAFIVTRSKRRNNDVSCFPEIKGAFNVAVRKKRGRRAPPTSRYSRGEKDGKMTGSDSAVSNSNHGTGEGHTGISDSISHSKECVDGRAVGLDLQKAAESGDSSDGASPHSSRKTAEQDQSTNSKELFEKTRAQTAEAVVQSTTGDQMSSWAEKKSYSRRSQQGASRLKQDGAEENVSANKACEKLNILEDASNVQAASLKKSTSEDKTSQAIMDDVVSDAQTNTSSSEDNSTEEVEDVKVCDICGDVGDEEKLAVCSRCGDGAEHIYCMRVMMEEVPEGEWLCEECQTEVDFEKEKKKLEKSQEKIGASKDQSFEGQTNISVNAEKSRSSSENEVEAETVSNKESNKPNQGNDMVTRRKEEDAGITSLVRQNHPEPGSLSMEPDSRKRVPLSFESSCRSDVEKGKLPTPQVPTSFASNAAKSQTPLIRGQISKSTSFNNSKVPKVKLVNEVPHKPKNLNDPLSCIMKKEGPIGFSTKSSSFKKPKSGEPANKAKSSILPPVEEPRAMDSVASRNANNDRGASILGCPSITGSTASLGNGELKKPLLAKAPASTTTNSAERSSGILGSGVQRKAIQNSDASHRDDKIKDSSSLRPGACSSSRTLRCQRCNESGHSTQFCAVDKLRLSTTKPSGERSLKDASAKRNKTSEATSLVSTENAASKSADQSEDILKYGPANNSICRPKDMLSTSFSNVPKPCQLYVRANEQDVRNSLSAPSSTASTDYSNLKSTERQAVSAKIGRPGDSSSTMSSHPMDKSSQGFSPADETTVSTVPELDYIWQGGFELWRTGRSPELCDGFQAHLSCSASPKVLEVAKKFPSKVQLEELPRQNSWPAQFRENGPTYDNIGVFFFARDTQSYENHYSKLVENMLNNDLVLRGNIETAELLIFPSNILSKNFQRWNMLYFLWGIFRVERKDHLNLPPDVPISKCQPNLNEDPLAVDQNKMGDSSGGYIDEPIVDVNEVPVTCSVSVNEEDEDSTPINLNDPEDFMDVDHEVKTGAADPVLHVSGSAHKRNAEMANLANGANGTQENKKIKLDKVGFVDSRLNENDRDGMLSSKVHPLATSSVDDCSGTKTMVENPKSNGKCIFPLDLNVVDDTVPECDAPDLELEPGDSKSPCKPIFSFLSNEVREKQNKGDLPPTGTSEALSLSLSYPASKEQATELSSQSQRQLSGRSKSFSIWDKQ